MKDRPITSDDIRWLGTALKLTSAEWIRSAVGFRSCERDEVMVQEGEEGEGLFVLFEGRVVVSKRRAKSSVSMPVRALLPGDFFGEIALLEKRARTATVMATEASSVFILDGRRIRAILESQPELSLSLRWKAGERLSELEWLDRL